MAKDCLMLPPLNTELAPLASLAEIAVTRGANHNYFVYFEFAKGLAQYREGHFASAAEWLDKVVAAGGDLNRQAQSLMVLAMAQFQLKQSDQSRATLAKGTDIIETKLSKPESGDLGAAWGDWITACILRKEAKALIQGVD